MGTCTKWATRVPNKHVNRIPPTQKPLPQEFTLSITELCHSHARIRGVECDSDQVGHTAALQSEQGVGRSRESAGMRHDEPGLPPKQWPTDRALPQLSRHRGINCRQHVVQQVHIAVLLKRKQN